MKKIIALAVAALFTLPTFALTIGSDFGFAPNPTSSDGVITKIAPNADGSYELVINSDSVYYSYNVKEGDKITVYVKDNKKAKNGTSRIVEIKSISANSVVVENVTAAAVSNKTNYADAK